MTARVPLVSSADCRNRAAGIVAAAAGSGTDLVHGLCIRCAYVVHAFPDIAPGGFPSEIRVLPRPVNPRPVNQG
jgi:hypothetical protein